MKKIVGIAGLLAAIVTMPAFAGEGLKIGFVDVQKILFTSDAGTKVKEDIEKLVSSKKDKIQKEEKAMKKMQEAFEKERLTMTTSQKDKKQKEFQDKLTAYKKMATDLQKTVQKMEADYTQKALLKIKDIINEIADKDDYNILLEIAQSGILYADDNMDVTDEVLKKFNK